MNTSLYLNGKKVSSDVLEYKYYQLKQPDFIIYNGYKYSIDFQHHIDNFYYYETIQRQSYDKLNNGIITDEEYSNICKKIANELIHHNLIDEDGHVCGKYNVETKIYYIYNERIKYQNKIYYIGDELGNTKGIYNFARMCVGYYDMINSKIELDRISTTDDNFDE